MQYMIYTEYIHIFIFVYLIFILDKFAFSYLSRKINFPNKQHLFHVNNERLDAKSSLIF